MGGGVVMRAAAKVAGLGVLNGGLRGAENPAVSAARQAGRTVASVVSSSDDVKLAITNDGSKTNSSVEKPSDDWDFAGVEDELFMDAGQPMPRLVFGGAPTIQEAKQATSDLSDALEKTYLSPNGLNEQMSLRLSDSEHVENKHYLDSETSMTPVASKHAIQAFRLLHENTAAQTVVASIVSDPNVWNAVMKNEALVDFLQTQKTCVVFPDMDPKVNDSSDESPQANESKSASGKGFMDYVEADSPQANESKSASGKGFMDYVEAIKQKITVTVVDMMTSLSDTFQSLFGGSGKGEYAMDPDGTAGISVEKTTIGATLMGLAIMVITVVVLKRV